MVVPASTFAIAEKDLRTVVVHLRIANAASRVVEQDSFFPRSKVQAAELASVGAVLHLIPARGPMAKIGIPMPVRTHRPNGEDDLLRVSHGTAKGPLDQVLARPHLGRRRRGDARRADGRRQTRHGEQYERQFPKPKNARDFHAAILRVVVLRVLCSPSWATPRTGTSSSSARIVHKNRPPRLPSGAWRW